ncbi:tRNA pseudouridine(55) synthase TruB [Parvularcula dongshanensis]|uniref:tRNA pseudouridine synthase B n=1 Tax=Parvularcula dongshanensis TaxID=1173995 RepID=A0A840HZX5_9PROT|nr:tRNA pseudouridine(55) synthase TruB [Parvularcula dongshanensis]MBB4658129.1 tRNA pseudouridine55 synthase [Parvularcula dongshanensis]
MARRKKGRKLSGWLILDKPYDLGSTEAVSRLRWYAGAQKAGHAGTLDPLATGLLPIAFGEATKTVPFVQDGLKTYRFTAKWGEATSTDDTEGEVIATSEVRPARTDIEAALARFTGLIQQRPPAFSAVKVAGERAYDLARGGEAVELAARPITIHSLRLVEADAESAVLEAVTGKGAYVRALVRDLAEALGTRAHVTQLRRTRVGPFGEDDMVTLEEATGHAATVRLSPEERDFARIDAVLLGTGEGLREHPQAPVDGTQAHRLRRGQDALLPPYEAKAVRGEAIGDVEPVLATEDGVAVAICRLEGLKLRPLKVFAEDG